MSMFDLPSSYDSDRTAPPEDSYTRPCPNCGRTDYEFFVVITSGTDKGNGYCSCCMSPQYDWYDDAEIPEVNR